MLTRVFLRNLATKAQHLRPVVLIGVNGLTATVHREVEAALIAHELIKIRVNASTREIRQEMITQMASLHHATIVKKIGHILVLYRANTTKTKSKQKEKLG